MTVYYWVSPTLIQFYPENVRKSLANSWVPEIGLGYGNGFRQRQVRDQTIKPLIREVREFKPYRSAEPDQMTFEKIVFFFISGKWP
jgi:hypothetical protein